MTDKIALSNVETQAIVEIRKSFNATIEDIVASRGLDPQKVWRFIWDDKGAYLLEIAPSKEEYNRANATDENKED